MCVSKNYTKTIEVAAVKWTTKSIRPKRQINYSKLVYGQFRVKHLAVRVWFTRSTEANYPKKPIGHNSIITRIEC